MLLPLDQAPLERIMEIDKNDPYPIHMLQYKIMVNSTQAFFLGLVGGGWGHTKD
jgi:hypothetical protein